jgi:hypothetical protein
LTNSKGCFMQVFETLKLGLAGYWLFIDFGAIN